MPKLAPVTTRRSWVACAATTVLAVAAVFPGLAAGARSHAKPVPQGFVGMVVDSPTFPNPAVDISEQMDSMVASGVDSIRVVFDWAAVQPYSSWSQVPAPDQSQFVNVNGRPATFSAYDGLVAAAAEHHLTILPVVQNAPAWAGQTYSGGLVRLPRSPAQYAAFVKALVEHYGPSGSFWTANRSLPKVPITMWQIWNEPNIPAFWPPQPYYSRYVALLRAAHNAIKAADPSAKVVLAGLPNYSWIEIARLARHGASKLYDVVAVHPYTKNPQGVITIIGFVRHELDRTGGRNKPILADEISWPSSLGQTTHDTGYDFATTQSGQARKVPQAMQLLAQNRQRLGIAGFYYYDWAGEDRPNYLAFDFAGLFHYGNGEFQPKPVFSAFQSAALGMEGCRSKAGSATDCTR
jgi:polysaccharide biosynthesis protein PslG